MESVQIIKIGVVYYYHLKTKIIRMTAMTKSIHK